MNLNDYELEDERQVFGNDTQAINRHSVRVYKIPGHDGKFYLDKTLDMLPPHYNLYTFPNARWNDQHGIPTFAQNIPVNGEQYFGAGLPWAKAIELAGDAIEKWFGGVLVP